MHETTLINGTFRANAHRFLYEGKTTMRGMKAAAVTIGLSAALTGSVISFAGPASAADCVGGYPPASCTLTISDSQVVVGQTVSYRGAGYTPGEKATATVHSTPVVVDTTTVTPAGVAKGSFTVPQVSLGQHTLTVVGATSGAERSVSFTIVAAPAAAPVPSGNGSLAFTGSDTAKTAGVGALLLLSGGALTVASKRRKRVNAAA
ncbi:hypothetical protein [Pedococcus sp. 2YAF34]|uniref:hypothetical protein n=1 Tax=Pedococcus sp. 2YAF34 TaxID=3233032 RepID=UPI003F9BC349